MPADVLVKGHSPPVASEASADYRLKLLARFALTKRAEEVDLPPHAQRLLAFLALSSGAQERSYVASSLWLGAVDQRASASLRTTLWKLRQFDDGLVLANAHSVSLGPGVVVDFDEAVADARRLLFERSEVDDAWLATLAWGRFDAELLPGWYEDWVIFERERFRQLRIHALEGLALALSRTGRHPEAVDAAHAAVAAEPLRETAQRALMSVHVAEGNLCEARRQFGLYRDLLRAELGVEPSIELRALVGLARSR